MESKCYAALVPKLNLPTLGVFRGWKPNQFLSNFSLQKSPVLFSRNLVTYMFSENDEWDLATAQNSSTNNCDWITCWTPIAKRSVAALTAMRSTTGMIGWLLSRSKASLSSWNSVQPAAGGWDNSLASWKQRKASSPMESKNIPQELLHIC